MSPVNTKAPGTNFDRRGNRNEFKRGRSFENIGACLRQGADPKSRSKADWNWRTSNDQNQQSEGWAAPHAWFESRNRPLALYSDKHGIFRVNAVEPVTGTGETQFGRAMRELGIEIICVNAPQAK